MKQETLQIHASEPIELYGTGTRAYPLGGMNDYEYSVGLSKKLPWGNTQEEDQMITRLNNEAYLLEEDKKILNFKNGLKNLYHQHCLDYKNYKSFKQNYQDFVNSIKRNKKHTNIRRYPKAELDAA